MRHSRVGYGKQDEHVCLERASRVTDSVGRDYTATYWPNKGIKGHELQTIYGKIIASDKSIADAASPSGG